MSTVEQTIPQANTGWRQTTKRRAFLSHLALSATVVGAVCALIFFVWYPAPYFAIKGAWNVLRVLVGVDLVVGPLLTLILFRPGKPGLAIDVTMIAMIQLSALLYGTSVIYQERPYYAVFAVDRFEVLARRDVDPAAAAGVEFARKPTIGPVLAYAEMPADPTEFQRLLTETLFEGKPDIERRPEYWRSYEDNRAAIMARAGKLSELAEDQPELEGIIRRASAEMGQDPSAVPYVPVIGPGGALTLVIEAETARPLRVLDIDPWRAKSDAAH